LNDNTSIIRTTGTWELALTAAATLGNGWYVMVFNDGAGVITVNPNASETINEASTLSIAAGVSAIIYCDGAEFIALVLSVNETISAVLGTVTFSSVPAGKILPAGVMMEYGGAAAPSGWLLCDGTAVSRTTYADLFTAISTTFGTGDGSTTFNVPDRRGRAGVGAGTGTLAEAVAAVDVNTTNNTFTVASNAAKWITGMVVQVSTTGTLPAPLAAATDYYLVRDSATTIKLATTLANAIAGTVIDITSQGTGTHTLTHTLTARTLGEKLGEETHGLVIAEIPSHTHTYESTGARIGQYVASDNPGPTTYPTGTTDATGGSGTHNLMQPSLVVNYIIKT
jgi:microcystin-dependent protein